MFDKEYWLNKIKHNKETWISNTVFCCIYDQVKLIKTDRINERVLVSIK